jgi:hypothetical protein
MTTFVALRMLVHEKRSSLLAIAGIFIAVLMIFLQLGFYASVPNGCRQCCRLHRPAPDNTCDPLPPRSRLAREMLLIATTVRDTDEIERAIRAFAHEPNGGLLVLPSPTAQNHRAQIIELAALCGLPAVYQYSFFATSGGLMSYGVDISEQFQQAAVYFDRILKGEKPADMPVQQPTKFRLVINLKTAKTLGLTVPLILQMTANEVIE